VKTAMGVYVKRRAQAQGLQKRRRGRVFRERFLVTGASKVQTGQAFSFFQLIKPGPVKRAIAPFANLPDHLSREEQEVYRTYVSGRFEVPDHDNIPFFLHGAYILGGGHPGLVRRLEIIRGFDTQVHTMGEVSLVFQNGIWVPRVVNESSGLASAWLRGEGNSPKVFENCSHLAAGTLRLLGFSDVEPRKFDEMDVHLHPEFEGFSGNVRHDLNLMLSPYLLHEENLPSEVSAIRRDEKYKDFIGMIDSKENLKKIYNQLNDLVRIFYVILHTEHLDEDEYQKMLSAIRSVYRVIPLLKFILQDDVEEPWQSPDEALLPPGSNLFRSISASMSSVPHLERKEKLYQQNFKRRLQLAFLCEDSRSDLNFFQAIFTLYRIVNTHQEYPENYELIVPQAAVPLILAQARP
jgi:hypothetical protein